jgi:hypothetical protein
VRFAERAADLVLDHLDLLGQWITHGTTVLDRPRYRKP